MEVLHLDYRPPTAGWVLPLQTRLRESPSPTLRDRYARWAEVGLAELGMAVATRLSIAFFVARRLGNLLTQLRDEIAASGEVQELLEKGYVYTPKDQALFYEICAATDAFFFEYRSAYEVLGRFFRSFGEHILNRDIPQADLLAVLEAMGCDTAWINPLKEHRKLFFHETAPWIALCVNQREPFDCSLIIMKKNLQTFDKREDYIVQPELVETIRGFQEASWRLRDWLQVQVEKAEYDLMNSSASPDGWAV